MEMSNTCTIPATVETTWKALNDPDFLKDCVAGCESIEPEGINAYKVLMAAKIGPVAARFSGRMRLDELDAPRAYTINFEGHGGVAGFAKGTARVALAPAEGNAATLMTYQVNAQVGGKLAQIGSRLVDGAARKVADDFFVAFTRKIASQQPGASDSTDLVQLTAASANESQLGGGWSVRRAQWALLALAAAGTAWLLAMHLG